MVFNYGQKQIFFLNERSLKSLWSVYLGLAIGILIIAPFANATELDDSLSAPCGVNGFAYHTNFSNENFRENENTLALNGFCSLSVFNQGIIVFTQVNAEHKIDRIRRLNVALPINLGMHIAGAKYGKIAVTQGWANDQTDAPSTARMALLPQAPYNSLFLTSSFATMEDATQLYLDWFGETLTFHLEGTYGDLEVGAQNDVQNYVIRTHLDNMELNSISKNWNLFGRISHHNVDILFGRAFYTMQWYRTGAPDIYSSILEGTTPFLYIDRLGFRITELPHDLSYETEFYWLEAYRQEGHSRGYYHTIRKKLSNNVEAFIGRTEGIPRESASAVDRYIGLSKSYEDWWVGAEYHKLRDELGHWSYKDMADTSSFAVSTVYRF